jgi:hypothetical protein
MVPIPGYARTVSAASIITLDEEHEKSGSPLVVFGEIERQYLVSETALSVLHRLPPRSKLGRLRWVLLSDGQGSSSKAAQEGVDASCRLSHAKFERYCTSRAD